MWKGRKKHSMGGTITNCRVLLEHKIWGNEVPEVDEGQIIVAIQAIIRNLDFIWQKMGSLPLRSSSRCSHLESFIYLLPYCGALILECTVINYILVCLLTGLWAPLISSTLQYMECGRRSENSDLINEFK